MLIFSNYGHLQKRKEHTMDTDMKIHDGWLNNVTHIPSPHQDDRPEGETPSLLVIHNISLPPGQFGGPYINQLFTGTLNPEEHLFLRKLNICVFRLTALFAVMVKLFNMSPLINEHGMLVNPTTKEEKSVMTFLLALS